MNAFSTPRDRKMPDRPPLPHESAPACLALSRFVATMPHLQAVLGVPVRRCRFPWDIVPGATVLAWGRKVSGLAAEAFAARHGLSVLHVEDGFLRSVHPGRAHPPCSISLDDQGIYYDASGPSRLETLATEPLDPERLARAARIMALWRQARVSKYNHAREFSGELPESYVLAVDQTRGDGSIRHGLAGPDSFRRMLEAALDEHPRATVVLKVHPEVVSGRKRGHFDMATTARLGRVLVFSHDVHPAGLLERAAAVYTVTSQVGFEGLIWGKPVRTFGMPFYAGWGLTRDDLSPPDRRRPVPLEQVVHAALVDYPRYVDPETGRPCQAERVIEWLGLQRRMRERFPAVVQARGFSRRQRPAVRRLLQGSEVRFMADGDRLSPRAAVVERHDAAAPPPTAAGVIRLGDGLLCDAGLLSDAGLAGKGDRPLSAFMASAAWDLETVLADSEYPPDLLARARKLRARIVAWRQAASERGEGTWMRPEGAKRVVLVVGQSDSPALEADLLARARGQESEAYLVYKPPPLILKSQRQGCPEVLKALCYDEIALSAPVHLLIPRVDAVHVLTSLAGFGALLHEKEVTCHGYPFYAGWGLTNDAATGPRRRRRLSLDELVAGAFILYPAYVSMTTGQFTTPECVLDELQRILVTGPANFWQRICFQTARRLEKGFL
ncbi:capsular polysaccharide biosynthesis protein [Desulfolutivibrio sulfoxidireducens]|nr:capsular polysaccharide biosynthesis protein [Desulfolutivibrio sulfoxidireducens]